MVLFVSVCLSVMLYVGDCVNLCMCIYMIVFDCESLCMHEFDCFGCVCGYVCFMVSVFERVVVCLARVCACV